MEGTGRQVKDGRSLVRKAWSEAHQAGKKADQTIRKEKKKGKHTANARNEK